MTHKAVLFDLDNTLYDYNRCHDKALKAVHKELRKHIKISEGKFNELFSESKREIQRELSGTASSHNRVLYFQRLIEKTHNTVDPNITLKLYDTYWGIVLKYMKPFDGVIEFLKDLKKWGYSTAIVSDLTTHIQLRKLKKLKIDKYIDVMITSEEVGTEKPHAIMFLMALNKLGVTKDEVWMVGDNPQRDIEGANALGIDTIQLLHGEHAKLHKEDYGRPNYSIKNFKDIRKIIGPGL